MNSIAVQAYRRTRRGTGVVQWYKGAVVIKRYTCAGVVQDYTGPEIVLLYMETGIVQA
jgi:hypothetical protein